MPASHLPSVWKMDKAHLQQELLDNGVPVHSKWTVPELRSMVTETREQISSSRSTTSKVRGLTKFSLAELVA